LAAFTGDCGIQIEFFSDATLTQIVQRTTGRFRRELIRENFVFRVSAQGRIGLLCPNSRDVIYPHSKTICQRFAADCNRPNWPRCCRESQVTSLSLNGQNSGFAQIDLFGGV
jgi:hypothetical protein